MSWKLLDKQIREILKRGKIQERRKTWRGGENEDMEKQEKGIDKWLRTEMGDVSHRGKHVATKAEHFLCFGIFSNASSLALVAQS